jgi:EAL domain-containing protein (putative c-di-GMP-specific phosphodiesterase class I)
MALSGRLSQILRDNGALARVSTDDFAILVWNAADRAEVEQMLDNIHTTISLPFNLGGSIVTTSVSIGIIYSSIGYTQPEDFLRAADTAMNESRLRSPGGTIVFDVEMQVRNQTRLQLETDLRQAINRQELFLNYQPIICLHSGLPLGFEALVRWQHPDRGTVSPLDFIPLAEETRLIVSLGEWVLREACQQLGRLQTQFPAAVSLSMNVNLSGVQLEVSELQEQIDQSLAAAGIEGNCLKVEVTESVLMSNPAQAIAILNQLKARQISICIDDFGTGYSSLSYLRHLPINTLKIDKSFVSGLDDPKNLDIVRAIVTLAQALELDVVAEGIETDSQLAILRSLGCSAGQGYLFSRPLAESQIADWLQEFTPCPE